MKSSWCIAAFFLGSWNITAIIVYQGLYRFVCWFNLTLSFSLVTAISFKRLLNQQSFLKTSISQNFWKLLHQFPWNKNTANVPVVGFEFLRVLVKIMSVAFEKDVLFIQLFISKSDFDGVDFVFEISVNDKHGNTFIRM